MLATSDLVEFSITEPEFNSRTYQGRFRIFQKTQDPRLALLSNKQILEFKKLLDDELKSEEQQKKASGKNTILKSKQEIKKLRFAQTAVNAAIHPDTKELIPWVMRVSSFLPMNVPIIFGFILAPPTPLNTIFWQWLNQTYNASMNYGNRNATSQYSTYDILKSYTIAVTSSISVGLIIRRIAATKVKGLKGSKLILMNSITSLIAASSASFFNAYIMRTTELEKGIDFYGTVDRQGESIGKSKICAQSAVWQTAVSRILLAMPLLFPSLVLWILEMKNMIPKRQVAKTTLEISLIIFELYFALPLGVALYPQAARMSADQLEEEFRNVIGPNGEKIRTFHFNKGL